jgi:hypothetical protein
MRGKLPCAEASLAVLLRCACLPGCSTAVLRNTYDTDAVRPFNAFEARLDLPCSPECVVFDRRPAFVRQCSEATALCQTSDVRLSALGDAQSR